MVVAAHPATENCNERPQHQRSIDALTDLELEVASGGVRHQVTREQYEKILAQMIKDANSR